MLATILGVTAVLCGPTAGWQPLETGGYRYIVQVSPNEVDMLQHFGEGFTSAVPSHVRDFREVVVRIGTGSVPQDPPVPHGDGVVAASGITTSDADAPIRNVAAAESDQAAESSNTSPSDLPPTLTGDSTAQNNGSTAQNRADDGNAVKANPVVEEDAATRHTVQRPQLELPSPSAGGTPGGARPNGTSGTAASSPWAGAAGNGGAGFGNLPTRNVAGGTTSGGSPSNTAAGAVPASNHPSNAAGAAPVPGASGPGGAVAASGKGGGTTASPFASSPFATNMGKGSSGGNFSTVENSVADGASPQTGGAPQWSNGTLFFLLLLSLSLNAYLIYITLDTRNRYFRLMGDLNDGEHEPVTRRTDDRYAEDLTEDRYVGESDASTDRERPRQNFAGRMGRIREMSRSAMSHLRRHGGQ